MTRRQPGENLGGNTSRPREEGVLSLEVHFRGHVDKVGKSGSPTGIWGSAYTRLSFFFIMTRLFGKIVKHFQDSLLINTLYPSKS